MALVVVSGAPGTGKSTVATAVAGDLGWPLLTLDPIKEALADVLGLGDEEWSNQLGDAAAEVVFRSARAYPDAVAEGWWRGARRERARSEFAGALEVFCTADPEEVRARVTTRHQGRRHPIHRDVMNPALIERAVEVTRALTPLGLGSGLVVVDTMRSDATAGAVAAVRAALGRAEESA
jgi:predicted kinase